MEGRNDSELSLDHDRKDEIFPYGIAMVLDMDPEPISSTGAITIGKGKSSSEGVYQRNEPLQTLKNW